MLALDARRFVVRDAAGRRLVSSARFTNSYAHPLYGAFQQPGFNEPSELARLGVIVDIQPGVTAPLFVAYRLRPGSTPPITVDYGGGTLSLPRGGVRGARSGLMLRAPRALSTSRAR
jgi:hypothetical protein